MCRIEQLVREIVRAELAAVAQPADAGERLLSVAGVAERTQTSVATVRRWLADGLLPVVTVPGRGDTRAQVRVRQADLDAWIQGLPSVRRGEQPAGRPLLRRVRSVAPRGSRRGGGLAEKLATRLAEAGVGAGSPPKGGKAAVVERARAQERAKSRNQQPGREP